MAAPDTVYRYHTNLQTKDSNGNVLNIRAAKPLLSYTDLATFKDKFKLSGVLGINNPDVPSANDAYDAGDSDRNGIIGYVKANNSDGMAAFHDIREGTFGSDSNSKDYTTRTWSRRASLKVLNGVECIILNDAGLNRRADVPILRPYFPFCNKFSVILTINSAVYNTSYQGVLTIEYKDNNNLTQTIAYQLYDVLSQDTQYKISGFGKDIPVGSLYNKQYSLNITTSNEEGNTSVIYSGNFGDEVESPYLMKYSPAEPTDGTEYNDTRSVFMYVGGKVADNTKPHYGSVDLPFITTEIDPNSPIALYSYYNPLLDYDPATKTFNNSTYKSLTGWYIISYSSTQNKAYYVDSNGMIRKYKLFNKPAVSPVYEITVHYRPNTYYYTLTASYSVEYDVSINVKTLIFSATSVISGIVGNFQVNDTVTLPANSTSINSAVLNNGSYSVDGSNYIACDKDTMVLTNISNINSVSAPHIRLEQPIIPDNGI